MRLQLRHWHVSYHHENDGHTLLLFRNQKDDLNSLGHELGALSSQADDDKIKIGLIDMMNRL
jgi:hypothetical protein